MLHRHFIDQMLRDLPFCYAYIDDILIASASEEEHKHHLTLVLEQFKEYAVMVNPSKCELGVTQLNFLDIWSIAKGNGHCQRKFK